MSMKMNLDNYAGFINPKEHIQNIQNNNEYCSCKMGDSPL
jgi:hypothetical protein